ncbi:hypothetical protein ACH5A2_22435 [Streptomyces collinus]
MPESVLVRLLQSLSFTAEPCSCTHAVTSELTEEPQPVNSGSLR